MTSIMGSYVTVSNATFRNIRGYWDTVLLVYTSNFFYAEDLRCCILAA